MLTWRMMAIIELPFMIRLEKKDIEPGRYGVRVFVNCERASEHRFDTRVAQRRGLD
jgi:hypothetical protein